MTATLRLAAARYSWVLASASRFCSSLTIAHRRNIASMRWPVIFIATTFVVLASSWTTKVRFTNPVGEVGVKEC